jgi:radical SAM superfamily enzyme YgiQ (UPF0313 family)
MYRAAFIDFSSNFYDKHPIYSLTSYLRSKGIDVYYIKEKNFQMTIARIKEFKPDVLLYSAFTSDIPIFIEFDKIVKEFIKVKSIIGGPGPTFDLSLSKRCTIDAFCIGEGEYALQEYILSGFTSGKNIILNGEISPPGYFQFANLDSLPFPERDLVYQKDAIVKIIPSKQFLTGRGCPYKCSYCFNNAFNRMFRACGNIMRKKSMDYVIAEIKEVKKKYPVKTAVFQDDTFIANKIWFFEFCDRFPSEIGLPYTCNVRANLVDESIVKALKQSGCVGVNWSIESGDDFLRNDVLKRYMTKEQIIETGRLLDKYKIPHRTGNIIGLPGENFEQMLETLRLNIRVRPTLSLANIFVPYPSLELTEYAVENNYLSKEALDNLPKNFFSHSVLNITDAENLRIQKLMLLFPLLVKFPFLFRNRLFKLLFALPKIILRGIYECFSLYNFWRMYKVETSLYTIFLLIRRYLKTI